MSAMLEDSVVVLLDIVEELVSLLVAGALLCALVVSWLVVSVLVPEVWAIETPAAIAAATARVVSVFRVAFIVDTPWVRALGHLAVGTPADASWFSD